MEEQWNADDWETPEGLQRALWGAPHPRAYMKLQCSSDAPMFPFDRPTSLPSRADGTNEDCACKSMPWGLDVWTT